MRSAPGAVATGLLSGHDRGRPGLRVPPRRHEGTKRKQNDQELFVFASSRLCGLTPAHSRWVIKILFKSSGQDITTAHTMSHPLDNPIWHALSTCQEKLAQVSSLARRFPVDVTSLAGVAEPTPESFAALASLTRTGGEAALFLTALPEPPAGWTVIEQVPLPQMVHHGGRPDDSDFAADVLTAAEVPQMMALAELTKPGPFGSRTSEMGNYLGVRREGRLVAMAGERMHLPGYTEVSAVCTHPEYLSQGLAAQLIEAVVRQIYDRDEVPFLHVRPDNQRAIALYERLGFSERTRLQLLVLRKDG